jgi:hypothetical protein
MALGNGTRQCVQHPPEQGCGAAGAVHADVASAAAVAGASVLSIYAAVWPTVVIGCMTESPLWRVH